MRGHSVSLLLLPPALLAVIVADGIWPRVRRAGLVIANWPPIARLHARIARLPPAIALPLFLVPEACSRLGWVVSAWLVLQGEAWRALAVYAGTKLIAGTLALWICHACLPTLLRVRAFAAGYGALMGLVNRLSAWTRSSGGGRFRQAMNAVRSGRLTAGS